jgi:poly [ADP-ribose] polymerase
MKKFVKLIMVTGDNNNKFYTMTHDGSASTFNVEYGRVEKTSTSVTYHIDEWDKKYKEKIKKGYKDVTDLIAVDSAPVVETEIKITGETKVVDFLKVMKAYRDGLVSKTYSVKAFQVTKAQLDKAQAVIDELQTKNKTKDTTSINDLLIELYTVIPRNMAKVQLYLLPTIDFELALVKEQDNLDAISSQVDALPAATTEESKEQNDLLKSMGVTMKVSEVHLEIQYLLNQSFGVSVKTIFRVGKAKEDKSLGKYVESQKNKTTKFLIHGTRCTSVLPIMEQGLKIRPSGAFHYSGKAYGNGIYFSETVVKSLGYTGYDRDKVIFVYEVHVGNPFKYEGWFKGNDFPLDLKHLNKRGFQSTYVAAGNGLLNSEIIVYTEQQCSLRYIIHLQ